MSVDFFKILKDEGIPTEQAELEQKWLEEVGAQNSQISNDNAYSPFWRIITALITKPVMWLINFMAVTVFPNSFVMTASDVFLDLLANAVNLSRKEANKAQGKITIERDNVNAAYTIIAGTVIQTAQINGIVYEMISDMDTSFSAGQSTVELACTAAAVGQSYNLASGYYSILKEPVAGISSVTNQANWLVTPGADTELDDDLRERVRNQFGTASDFHTDSVYRSLIAEFTAVKIDAIWFEHNAPRGPGTANAFVLFDFNAPVADYLNDINHYITDQGHHGHGDDLQVYQLPETQHDLIAEVWYNEFLEPLEISALQSNIENFIRAAFRENLEYPPTLTLPFVRFSFSRLAQELHREFDDLHSIDFNLNDIVSDLNVPTLSSLTINMTVTE